MKTQDELYTEIMEGLRSDGWCIVLKALPKEMAFIIEGSRSEYDAPCPDREIGKGKWMCEVQDTRWLTDSTHKWRHDHFAFGDTPGEAISKVTEQLKGATK